MRKRRLLAGILFLLILWLLIGCGAPSGTDIETETKTETEWYSGGTLHKATVAEWHNATYANRLATCADWVVVSNRAEAERDFSTVKPKAIEVEICITEATKGIAEIQHHQVAEYAALCLIELGYKEY